MDIDRFEQLHADMMSESDFNMGFGEAPEEQKMEIEGEVIALKSKISELEKKVDKLSHDLRSVCLLMTSQHQGVMVTSGGPAAKRMKT